MTRRSRPVWLAAYALPPLAWAGVIFWLSGRTGAQASGALGPAAGFPAVSEAIHFGEFLLLAWLVFRALAATGARAGTRPNERGRVGVRDLASANLAGIIAFGYALSDEYHQTFVPGRSFSVIDLAVDLAGIVTGVAAAWSWQAWRRPGISR